MTTPTRVIFVKCKPRGVNAVEFCRDRRMVFLGYPAWKSHAPTAGPYDQRIHALSDPNWSASKDVDYTGVENKGSYQRSISTQRNLASDVRVGDIVLVPALTSAAIYAARIAGAFRVVGSPEWRDAFLALRSQQGSRIDDDDDEDYVSDVVQGWPTEDWISIPFAALPRWLTVTVFRRSSVGRVKHNKRSDDGRAAAAIDLAIAGSSVRARWDQTNDPREVLDRLQDVCSPDIFEHLVVSLLQLEQPERCWLHVGGTGDGGADGLAHDGTGTPVARLQCKLEWNHDRQALADEALRRSHAELEVFAATLSNLEGDHVPSCRVFEGDEIASLLIRHARRIPLALSIRAFGID